MKDKNYIEKVRKLHERFDLPVVNTPTIPSKNRCDLRVELIQEELNELKDAIEAGDLVEVADALCDIQYVLSGTVLEFGMADKFIDLFDEVQRSNMSKACKDLKEVAGTQIKYLHEKSISSYVDKLKDGTFGVYRSNDSKLLKSINYYPANLNPILDL